MKDKTLESVIEYELKIVGIVGIVLIIPLTPLVVLAHRQRTLDRSLVPPSK